MITKPFRMVVLALWTIRVVAAADEHPPRENSAHLKPFPAEDRIHEWIFSLEPAQMATYNVSIAPSGTAPDGTEYRFQSSTHVVNPPYNENTLWTWQVAGGGMNYVCHVLNTYWLETQATVAITCRWARVAVTGGGGAGGGGTGVGTGGGGRDHITGWARGIANHQDAEFIVSALEIDGAPDYLCINEVLPLYAWLVIGEYPYGEQEIRAIEADWTVAPVGEHGGDGFFEPSEFNQNAVTFVPVAPGRVVITATVPGREHLSDSVTIIIVQVEIEADPEPGNLICVDGTKNYTAVVTPAEVAALGEFEWSVSNEDKLGFVDDENTGQTVTVFGKQYSAAVDAEELTVEFRIDGELICAPSTNLTVFEVEFITAVPKGWPQNESLPETISIGAGAIESPAHQADVVIKVTPVSEGIPVFVKLVGGLGYEEGKTAKLKIGTTTLVGEGEGATFETSAGGVIEGVLTSSDVINDCTIQACQKTRFVNFTWDEFIEEDEWTFDPMFLPVPGVLTNYLRLHHHRLGETADEPRQPLDQHKIRFFVEKVEYWENGILMAAFNEPDNHGDLSEWASFPAEPYTTDANGLVEALLTVQDRSNLWSITMVAYDWGVYREPAPPAPEQQGMFFMSMQAGGQEDDDKRNIVAEPKGNDLAPFVIRVDTDRNGVLTSDDLAGRRSWNIEKGAFIPPAHLKGAGPHSVINLPSFDVYVNDLDTLQNVTLQLRLPSDSSDLRILSEEGTILVQTVGEAGAHTIPIGSFSEQGIATFRIISDKARTGVGGPANPARTVELYAIEGETTRMADYAKVKTAPVILPWEMLPAEKVYVCDARFPTISDNVPGPLASMIERVNLGSQWIQDKVEFAKVQCNTDANAIIDVVTDLGHTAASADTIYNYFSANKPIRYVNWRNTGGHGGDIMISPPYGSYAYGRAIIGSKASSTAEAHIKAQGVQGPPIKLDTSWLDVGHVDELLAFVDQNTLLMPCPYKASTLIHERLFAGGQDDPIWFGFDPFSESQTTIRELTIAKTPGNQWKIWQTGQSLPSVPVGDALSDWITVPHHRFVVGDHVRFGVEIARVANAEIFPDNPQNNRIRLSRGINFGTGSPFHPAGTWMYAYTENMVRSLVHTYINGMRITSPWHRIQAVRNSFVTQSGWSHDIVLVPVLFARIGYETVVRAATANVVNCLPLYPHVYMQHPGNIQWTNNISVNMSEGVTIHFLAQPEIWNNYHILQGSIHCGSAARRTIDFTEAWWNKSSLQNWE